MNMRVLIVSGLYLFPNNKGDSRNLLSICEMMRERDWQMDFLYWGDRIAANLEGMREYFGEDHFYLVAVSEREKRFLIKSRIRCLLDKFGITKWKSYPYDPDELYYHEVGEKAKRLYNKNHYDVIWLEYYFQSKLFSLFDLQTVKVIHTLDRFAGLNKWFQRLGKIPGWYYLSRKGECTALSRADVVVAIQDDDNDYFKKLLEKKNVEVVTIGHVVDEKGPKYVDNQNYGFIGATNILNIQAITYYIQQILPIVKKRKPELNLFIAGAVCDYIPDSEDYCKLGIVSKLEDFYDKISFVISPLVIESGGLNIKNMEALAFGKPIVTTSISVRQGIKGSERAIMVCDKANQFAEGVIELGENGNLRRKMSREALDYIKKYNCRNRDGIISIEEIRNAR